jgi:hypothetical protein
MKIWQTWDEILMSERAYREYPEPEPDLETTREFLIEMKTSNEQNPRPREKPSILLIGPPGGGKTYLYMSLPGPLEIHNCDNNLDGPETDLKKSGLKPNYDYHDYRFKDDGSVLPMDEALDVLVKNVTASKDTRSRINVIDSLSIVNEFIVRKVLGTRPRTEIAILDWTKIKYNYLELLVAKLRTTGKACVVTVHEEPNFKANEKNPMIQEVLDYDPMVQGSTKHALAGYFTDVWRCYREPAPGGRQDNIIQVNPTTKSRYLKNSFGMTEDLKVKQHQNPWDVLRPHLEGKL